MSSYILSDRAYLRDRFFADDVNLNKCIDVDRAFIWEEEADQGFKMADWAT